MSTTFEGISLRNQIVFSFLFSYYLRYFIIYTAAEKKIPCMIAQYFKSCQELFFCCQILMCFFLQMILLCPILFDYNL